MTVEIIKRIRKENHTAFSQEQWLEHSTVRNRQSKRPIDKYPYKQITELNDLI